MRKNIKEWAKTYQHIFVKKHFLFAKRLYMF